MMKATICILLVLLGALTMASDPVDAFSGFTEKLVNKGYRRLPEPHWTVMANAYPLVWWCNVEQDGRTIRIQARLTKGPRDGRKAIADRRRSSQGAYVEVPGTKRQGLITYWVGRPYNFVTDIIDGRIHVEYWQFEKDPGGKLDDGAAKNPEIRRMLKMLAVDLQQRAAIANRMLAEQ